MTCEAELSEGEKKENEKRGIKEKVNFFEKKEIERDV